MHVMKASRVVGFGFQGLGIVKGQGRLGFGIKVRGFGLRAQGDQRLQLREWRRWSELCVENGD